MKIMNEIKSDFNGEVLEVLVENGQMVDFRTKTICDHAKPILGEIKMNIMTVTDVAELISTVTQILFIDRVDELVPGEHVVAHKT